MKHKILGALLLAAFVFPGASSAQSVADLQAQINTLLGQLQSLQQQLAVAEAGQPAQWCHTFNTNLQIGNTGSEVTALQTALQKDGEPANITGSFDDQTASAVTGFQEEHAGEVLLPTGLRHGTGFVGNATRRELNILFGCGNIVPLPPQPVPPPVPTPTSTPNPVPSAPAIISLSPLSGQVGATVTIIGTGFTATGNTVNFGSNVISNLSSNGTSVVFTVPSYTHLACRDATPPCYAPDLQISPGNYPVSVTDPNGTSNSVSFTVVGKAQAGPKTFSIVITPKMISDFNNPLPSIKQFYDNYQPLMSTFSEQQVIFYVGSGDQIFNYPVNAFSSPVQQTRTIWNGAALQFDPAWNGYYNGAQTVLDTQDTVAGENSYQVITNGPNVRQATISQLFPFGQGILIKKFPKISWSWKKDGGSTLTIAFLLSNRDTGDLRWVGYYAGVRPQGADLDHWAQFNVGAVPTAWTNQEVDIEHDLLSIYARTSPNEQKVVAQNWEIVGMALDPYDGNSAHFANIQAATDVNDVKWAQNSETAVNSAEYLNQIGNAYPQPLNYSQLKNIFAQFRSEGQRRGLNVKIFDGIEPGREFTVQPWKFAKHPEVVVDNIFRDINLQAPLGADPTAYAAYPQGIPQGTIAGDFIINQTGRYVSDMGLDGIYSTNGFGLFPEGRPWLATPSPAKTQFVLSFFKKMKAALGGKQVIWMDSYLSTQINEKYWSMSDEAYNYIDYLEISTFFQDSQGVPSEADWINSDGQLNQLLGTPGKTGEQYIVDTITSELALKQNHPNLKVLWTYYFNDPWYPVGFGQNTNTTAIAAYKDQLDGMMVYSNNYLGNNIPQSWLAPLFNVFPH